MGTTISVCFAKMVVLCVVDHAVVEINMAFILQRGDVHVIKEAALRGSDSIVVFGVLSLWESLGVF